MAKKVKTNLADLSNEDIAERLEAEKARLKKFRFSHAVTPLENPMQLRESRREVARLLTETKKRAVTVK
jgi:large subunit ribosomal protein L29